MERILSVNQMRVADEFTVNKLGINESELIERAGKSIADELNRRFHGGRVLVCIGKGNNGADGKVVAQILSKIHGFTVTTLTVSNGIFKLFDRKYDIIIDCIFGTGLNRNVEGKFKTAIEKINQSGAYIVSCDIPSGLNGDNGKVMGVAVKANLTIAIQEYKLGHFLGCGPDYCGEIISKDIGISIWGEDFVKRFNDKAVAKFFPHRNRHVHKGCFGKACVIGGSVKYSGSVLLSANALCALKMGAGYVNIVVPESLFNAYIGKVPECILTPIKDVNGFSKLDNSILSSLLKYDSIAIGMGMGVNQGTYDIVSYLLQNYHGRLIIDADGINSLAQYGADILINKKCTVILTPHIGEFSRLSKLSVDEILNDPINVTKNYAKEFGCIVLLKDSVSVISDGEEVYINTTGSPALAKAGSGDVLSGLAAGILARTDESFLAIVSAAYLFGKVGELAQSEQNEYTVIASDLINLIPNVINQLR